MVEITMQELLEAGVHFGHQTRRWNPKMKPYIFGKRNGIYIIDLSKTLKQFREAADFVYKLGQEGRRLLFVGTKRQAQDAVAEEARRCGQYFVTHRWLGGTLTNFVTIRQSVERLLDIESRLAELRTALEGDDVTAINSAADSLEQASHALAQTVYEKAQSQAANGAQSGNGAVDEDEVVEEAEYEVIDEDKAS